FDTLGDRRWHLARLAVADADHAIAVSDDHERGEAEATTALHDLRDAVDGDDSLQELALVGVAATALLVRVALAPTPAGLARLARRGGAGSGLDRGSRLDRCSLRGRPDLGRFCSHRLLLLICALRAHRLNPP